MTDREKLIELIRVPIKIMPEKTFSPTLTATMTFAEKLADILLSNGVRLESKQATSEENKRMNNDVSTLVRCKDCKNRPCNRVCKIFKRQMDDDCFCSFGERVCNG